MDTIKTPAFWQGTNFWTALALFVGGLFVGFPDGEAQTTVGYLFATLGGIMAIREKLKNTSIDWRAWIGNKNTWAYLGTVVVSVLPAIPLELFDNLSDRSTAALGGNWQGIWVAFFSIGKIIFHLVKPKAPAELK